jgi:hypothetical protein
MKREREEKKAKKNNKRQCSRVSFFFSNRVYVKNNDHFIFTNFNFNADILTFLTK